MKKGDLVIINDGSYAQTVRNGILKGEFRHYSLGSEKHCGKTYVVVEVGCSFPLDRCCQPTTHRNDTVIQEEGNGEVVFIHHRFLSLAKHRIVIDNKAIEISYESYLNIKKQFQN